MNLGMGELILIFIVALLVFGPKKLPELGKSLGRAMHEFKKATNELKSSLETEVGTAQIKEELLKQQQEIQSGLAAITSAGDTKQPETEEAYAAGSAEVKTETAAASKSEAPAEEKKPETSEASKSHAG